MLYTLDLEHPETFPAMVKPYHFEEMSPMFSKIHINMELKSNLNVILDAKDEFFEWLQNENTFYQLKDNDWKVFVSNEHKRIKLEFFTPQPTMKVARTFGEKLGLVLINYTKHNHSI